MSGFTETHREQLRDFFGGHFAGRMGLCSWAGPMLEHAQAAALHPIDRSTAYMPVAPVDHSAQRANRDIGDDARAAARAEGHIRAALRGMDVDQVRVLRLQYTPQPPTATRALVGLALGEQRAMELTAHMSDPDREKRREAKKLLDGGLHQANALLERAHEAYAEAEALAKEAAKADRVARFERTLGASA